VQPIGDQMTLELHGELDLATVNELTGVLNECIANPQCIRVVVDLSDVTFIDSVTISALIHAYNNAANAGHTLSIVGATGAVRRVLELTGVLDVLTGRLGRDARHQADRT
jgi:anti-sigma B factor antagonist